MWWDSASHTPIAPSRTTPRKDPTASTGRDGGHNGRACERRSRRRSSASARRFASASSVQATSSALRRCASARLLLRLCLALALLFILARFWLRLRDPTLLRLGFALAPFFVRRLLPRLLLGAAFCFDLSALAFGLGLSVRFGFLLLPALVGET